MSKYSELKQPSLDNEYLRIKTTVDLYNTGQYHNAIEYSLYARRLCYQTLQSNGARYRVIRYDNEFQFRSRDDRQLNDELRSAYPDQPADDQAVLTFSFNFNVN
jgi:hypothetical protein